MTLGADCGENEYYGNRKGLKEMARYIVMMTSKISSICRTLPSEIVRIIHAYMPRDRDMTSHTVRCIRLAIYKYEEHRFWNYHAWLL